MRAALRGQLGSQYFSLRVALTEVAGQAGKLISRDRIGQSDRKDFEQDLKLNLLRRLPKSDPALGGWNGFVSTVTERYVATFLEWQRAQKRGAGQKFVPPSRILSSPCARHDSMALAVSPASMLDGVAGTQANAGPLSLKMRSREALPGVSPLAWLKTLRISQEGGKI